MTKRELEAENARLRSELEVARAGIERLKHTGSLMLDALCQWNGIPSVQKPLFSGLDCLPGQQDLFETDGET